MQPVSKAVKSRKSSSPKVDHAWFADRFESVGISQRGVAKELGIDHSSLANSMTGMRKLQIQEAIDLARILRVPLREIIERAGYDLRGIGL